LAGDLLQAAQLIVQFGVTLAYFCGLPPKTSRFSENNMVARADHGMIPVGDSVPTRSANESDA
jgi:hypothetical protein